jgi:hypothetical protein
MKITVKDLWLDHKCGEKIKLNWFWDQEARNG